MNSSIEQAKQTFIRTSDTLLKIFNNTAPDRMNWSPSPTARTPVQVLAHSAHAVRNIQQMFEGNPFAIPRTDEAEKVFAEHDQMFTSAEEVVAYWEEGKTNLLAFYDGLTESDLDRMCTLPFGLGQAPLGAILTAPSDHTVGHIGQLEYIQTIYGDRHWHFMD